MKVAIIGAGPSGMACALELERHGIAPVIFEQRHRPGELFDHCGAVLEIFTRPNDPLSDIKKNYSIELRPINSVRTIVMKSPKKEVTVKGNMGYFFMRGGDPHSAESQLYSKFKGRLTANTKVHYTDLYRDYDYVVVATGGRDVSRAEGIWSTVFSTNMIGGTVIGRFDLNKLSMWMDKRYSKNAYAYLAPMEKKRAFLGLVVPESTVEEAREMWKNFWMLEAHPFEQVNEIIVEHNAGFVYPHQVGNLLFVGIAGGFQEPFLGFGLISAIKSGVLAGRAIATGRRYEDLLVQLKEDMKHSLVLREMFNSADNSAMDNLMMTLKTPGLKPLIYNTNIDFVRMGTSAVAHIKKVLNKLRIR